MGKVKETYHCSGAGLVVRTNRKTAEPSTKICLVSLTCPVRCATPSLPCVLPNRPHLRCNPELCARHSSKPTMSGYGSRRVHVVQPGRQVVSCLVLASHYRLIAPRRGLGKFLKTVERSSNDGAMTLFVYLPLCPATLTRAEAFANVGSGIS